MVLHRFKSKRWFDSSYMIIAAAIVGMATGFASIGFQKMIEYVHRLFFQEGKIILFTTLGPYYTVLLPASGALIVSLIIKYLASETKGEGVPEVILAVDQKNGLLKPRLIVDKAVTSAIILGSGGSAGKEGPVIQIGAAIGSTVAQIFKLPPVRMKNLAACGAAGGIAAAFNAPIGGILFAQEIILRESITSDFILITVASVTSTMVSRKYLGNYPAFFVPQYSLSSIKEMILFIVLGVLGGLFAVLYIKTLYKAGDIFNSLHKVPSVLKPVLGGLMVGIIGIYFPQIFGVGYDTVGQVLKNQLPWLLVLCLLFMKLIATSLTLGSGSPGGDFAPGLYMGAMLGGSFGFLANHFLPGITSLPVVYALVGMGSVLAGQYQAPVMAIMIVFEMTSDYKLILPLMLACVLSSLVARGLYPETIYTEKLARQGNRVSKSKNINVMACTLVQDIMTVDVVCLDIRMNLDKAIKFMNNYTHSSFPVLDYGKLVGVITYEEVVDQSRIKGSTSALEDIMGDEFVVVEPHDNLEQVINKMAAGAISGLPVVDPGNHGHLIGFISHSDIINAYISS